MPAKTILVVVDPSAEQPHVLERAGWLAERAGADVELFACDYDANVETGPVASVWVAEPGIRERKLLERRQQLESLADVLRARGIAVTVDAAWDFPVAEAIVRKVAASQPWVVAKDTEHHSVIQRTLLSNTDWLLIRNCPAPLWLVKPRAIAARPLIMAAVDPVHEHDKPAELDDAILRFAKALATGTDGTLEVVHAFALPMDLELPPDARELVLREHREAMTAFIKTHDIPKDSVRLIEGRAVESLRRAAVEHNADFIVMGAIARRGLSRLFIGSTAERVLDKLPCDLVIVKPANFAPP
jgi:universal stress protein E